MKCLVVGKNQKRRRERRMTRTINKNESFSNWFFSFVFLLAGHSGWSDNFASLDVLARKEMEMFGLWEKVS